MTLPPSARLLSLALLALALTACQDRPQERAEELGPKTHRVTVDLGGEEPAESRLAKDTAAICPAGGPVCK